MRVVITGASGLIGRALVRALEPAHDVWAVSRRPAERPSARVRHVVGDLAAGVLPVGLPPAADVLVHLAQSRHYRDFPAQALDIFNVNVASTARLLDWSRQAGVRHFILASSGAVSRIGSGELSYYAASKQSAELLAESYASAFAVLVLRFFFVYGPGQERLMLVPRLIDRIMAGETIAFDGAEGASLNPVYVADAVSAIERAVSTTAAGRIEIAGPEVLSFKRIADTLAGCLGRSVGYAPAPGRTPVDLVGDTSAMAARLVAPEWSFARGAEATIRAEAGDRA